ncbi:uncharacterized protein Bfra_009288 [Botrytis fragariae]|uniref:Uncharacterized protein n=1 Tax=Botrytis fragariae TaxID=1964551 RepID=A0A8H6EFV2_9HELO|nr:uncharacterized protein Bfra_009288 [Botrytis fragariae]KAF5870737.1 hypothetical protein Bfra_009288 [Botrytis fragariae]
MAIGCAQRLYTHDMGITREDAYWRQSWAAEAKDNLKMIHEIVHISFFYSKPLNGFNESEESWMC